MKVQGGFLPLLAGLASQALPFLTSTVLPALGVGALSGLASTGVQKLVGNGRAYDPPKKVKKMEATLPPRRQFPPLPSPPSLPLSPLSLPSLPPYLPFSSPPSP